MWLLREIRPFIRSFSAVDHLRASLTALNYMRILRSKLADLERRSLISHSFGGRLLSEPRLHAPWDLCGLHCKGKWGKLCNPLHDAEKSEDRASGRWLSSTEQ